MDDIKRKMIEKIALLSKFTEKDSGAFQGEISNAAAKIQEIMDKYSITADEVDAAKADKSNKEMEQAFSTARAEYMVKGLKKWHWDLAKAISMMTHTKHFASTHRQSGHMKFFGRDENAALASQLFAEWVQVIEMMAVSATDDYWKLIMKKYDYASFLKRKKAGDECGKFMDSVPYSEQTTYYKISWLEGCIQAILQAVYAIQRERDETTVNAIVLYKEKLETGYELMKKQVGMRDANVRAPRAHSSAGYSAGREAGSKINLTSKRIV